MKAYTNEERKNHVAAWKAGGLSQSAYTPGTQRYQALIFPLGEMDNRTSFRYFFRGYMPFPEKSRPVLTSLTAFFTKP
jgi:hypothetical protein